MTRTHSETAIIFNNTGSWTPFNPGSSSPAHVIYAVLSSGEYPWKQEAPVTHSGMVKNEREQTQR